MRKNNSLFLNSFHLLFNFSTPILPLNSFDKKDLSKSLSKTIWEKCASATTDAIVYCTIRTKNTSAHHPHNITLKTINTKLKI